MTNQAPIAGWEAPPSAVPRRFGRAALVGPLPPFRGGIAQHTTMLYRALKREADLLAVSFTRQYPAWLFPGASDREPGVARLDDPACAYLIDSLDPLSWRRAFGRIRDHGPELLLIPWWAVYWTPCLRYLAGRARKHGMEVRFFCHNVIDHEAAAWKTVLTRAALARGDSFVVQAETEAEKLRRAFPGKPVLVHPHPLYDQFPAAAGSLAPRAGLELLFYGFVRPYKGLDLLIEALGRLPEKAVHLTVVGEFWSGLDETRESIRRLGLEDRIELVPRYVSEQETAEYFARADALVLPYRGATGSGVLSLAYHYAKPVIATAVGGLPDVVREGETGHLVPPGDPAALAAAIAGLTRDGAAAMAPAIRALALTMTWESLARCVLAR